MRSVPIIAAIGFVVATLCACEDSSDPVNGNDDTLAITGITETIDHSTTVGDDTTDWQPRSLDAGNGLVAFRPAVPNPAAIACSVVVNVSERSYVKVVVVNRVRDTVIHLVDALFYYPGPYVSTWDLTDDKGKPVQNDIYRMYTVVTSALDSTRRVESHGDVRVQR